LALKQMLTLKVTRLIMKTVTVIGIKTDVDSNDKRDRAIIKG